MAVRTIRLLGDNILREKCKPVEIFDEQITNLLQDMLDTLRHTKNGAALAAPQVGVLSRAVVIDLEKNPIFLVNPKIIERQGCQKVTEGCLSIPGVWGKLMRPKKVKVKAFNEKGTEFFLVGEGELAKCLCHEIDHLDGILFIDKVDSKVDY
ncbi:MAG: peptide deformylase [Peptococcaceae bacterium]|nr:peptide deformylase [Peptococcaceae bacterium]